MHWISIFVSALMYARILQRLRRAGVWLSQAILPQSVRRFNTCGLIEETKLPVEWTTSYDTNKYSKFRWRTHIFPRCSRLSPPTQHFRCESPAPADRCGSANRLHFHTYSLLSAGPSGDTDEEAWRLPATTTHPSAINTEMKLYMCTAQLRGEQVVSRPGEKKFKGFLTGIGKSGTESNIHHHKKTPNYLKQTNPLNPAVLHRWQIDTPASLFILFAGCFKKG